MLLLLLLQVFESSNQSSYNESCKDLLPKKRRRSRIPDKPNYSLNLWSIMKNCIGKELSKIPMPVSEPQGVAVVLKVLTSGFGSVQSIRVTAPGSPAGAAAASEQNREHITMWHNQPGVWLPLM